MNMQVLHDGLELRGMDFCFQQGRFAGEEKAAQYFSDKTATGLMELGLEYAQHDGDHRLDAVGDQAERKEFGRWRYTSRQAMAGVPIETTDTIGLPFGIRLERAERLGGVAVRAGEEAIIVANGETKEEAIILADMVELMPGRRNSLNISNVPKYGRVHRDGLQHVVKALREPYSVERIRPDFDLNFEPDKGTSVSFGETQDFTRSETLSLFETALWYAQKDGHGDRRLDAKKIEGENLRLWRAESRRGLTGLAMKTTEEIDISFRTRLEHAQFLGGITVRKNEAEILADMVEWLPKRVQYIPDGPNYGPKLQAADTRVVPVLRKLQPAKSSHGLDAVSV